MTKMACTLSGVTTVLIVLAVACGGATPTPTILPTATATLTPAPTTASVPTPTTTPTPTPVPTPTPIPLPVASFSFDVSSENAPVTVQFTDTSQGAVTGWQWDMGDGATSIQQDPIHVYTTVGSYTVEVTVSGPGGSQTVAAPRPIMVMPGPLAEVVVTLGAIAVQVQGTARLQAKALDQFGNQIGDAVLDWSLTGPEGIIDETGLFTAGTQAGSYEGLVQVATIQGAQHQEALIDVTITPGALSTVAIEPADVTLAIDATQPFSFKAIDAFGNEISDVLSSWSVSGEVGGIDANGVFTTGNKAGLFFGAIRVEVVQGTERATAMSDVAIRPDPLASIKVEPSPAVVRIGESVSLTATGVDDHGNEIPGLAFLWDAPRGVSIHANGKFTAGGSEDRVEVEVRAIYNNSEHSRLVTVAVLDLPFRIGSSVPAVVAQEEAANAILAPIFTERRKDFARISFGSSIHAVSSGLFGTDPCTGTTARAPCTDPRDVIDPLNQLSGSIEQGHFIFGRVAPQFLIIDLGEIRGLDSIGAQFDWRLRDRGIDSFGVFVSLDGLEYTPLSAPVNHPNPPTFFSVDPPVQARFIAYYFGRCAGPNCSPEGGGSRVFEVYARGATK